MKWIKLFLLVGVIIAIAMGVYHTNKPLPDGLSYASRIYPIQNDQVQFLADHTYQDEQGQQFEHEIFDTILTHIAAADRYILADLFLFNDQHGTATTSYRALSDELSAALVERAAAGTDVTVVTDPINTAYGSYLPDPLQTLADSEANLVFTALPPLRDSNPLYSALYRTLFTYIPDIGGHWLPNPFDPQHPNATISAYLRGLHFKANHRKVVLTESGGTWRSIVTSFNPHDGSSRHSNVAIALRDVLASDVLKTEQSVLAFSTTTTPALPDANTLPIALRNDTSSDASVQLLTERAIKDRVLADIVALEDGDDLLLAMFYLSDRDIITSLKAAAARGVDIRLVLDPNRDAFGREKNGIPNRPVAHELQKAGKGNIAIRWCATSGEQCHSKVMLTQTDTEHTLLVGSANFTRRNLDNYNLETSVHVQGTEATTAIQSAHEWFEQIWHNQDERTYSVSYDLYADDSFAKTVWYRLGEFTGISHY